MKSGAERMPQMWSPTPSKCIVSHLWRIYKLKLPNRYGSVYKLSGKRRNPYCARKTIGWTWSEEKKKSFPIYHFIGYYATRAEALTALSDYNKNPIETKKKTNTFE